MGSNGSLRDDAGSDDASTTSSSTAVMQMPLATPRPSIHDKAQVLRPGDFVDVSTIIRNWWAFPAVGFNSILEIPIHKLECLPSDDPPPVGQVTVPNSIFGLPIRKDLV